MLKLVFTTAAVAVPSLAYAHVGVGGTIDLMHGFTHPLSGLDHMLAMVAVGMLAARTGGRALWAIPMVFIAMMTIGGMLGAAGVQLPLVEISIGCSVVTLGVAVAFGLRLSAAVAASIAGFFAIFHGHAHGAEMPETASGLSYGLGFVLATGLLHCAGIGLGLTMNGIGGDRSRVITRMAGSTLAVAGVGLLVGLL